MKKYILDMFPYPSGAGLHVGHVEGYTGTDVYSRYLRMRGYQVLHPMGWDAFGLPAENYAIKNKILPAESTSKNIETFKRQIKAAGLDYDWDREIDSSSPQYYKWTQWLFILLWKQGLVYKEKAPANWCPSCQTVLANEQVVEGKCERCETLVAQRDLEQWFFRITEYADRLIEGLETVDWPKSTKLMQKNWIGRKEGIVIKYSVLSTQYSVEVFTTRPDTNFGATFVVLAPEHELCLKIATSKQRKQMEEYIAKAQKKTELERVSEGRKKTGVFTGRYAINQLNGKEMPIWISDFVLKTVGTGALVGVPGSDQRDYDFAKEFGLERIKVIEGENEVVEDGILMNSEFLNGLGRAAAIPRMMDYLERKGWGKRTVTYHLRDWLVSRQRYWGAPIPMIYCEKDGWNPVPVEQLPVVLPTDVDFKPTGQSPIALSKTFQQGVKCPKCGGKARREVDTMDTFVDSSWYFLRFCDPKNDKEPWNAQGVKKWMPVDLYVGGAEHTVLHLMYSRFFYKVFCDVGLVDKSAGDEPFLKLRHPGTILGEDSRKMSKRWGNVINPDEVVAKFGADTLRMYEMFMGPFEATKPWRTTGAEGVHRFLGRVERLFDKTYGQSKGEADGSLVRQISRLVKKVGSDIEEMSFNTAIAKMMETLNLMTEVGSVPNEAWEKYVLVMAPFAPFVTQELWQKMGKKDAVYEQTWPAYDETKIGDEKALMAIQVDGKTRGVVEEQEGLEEKVVEMKKIKKYIEGKTYKVIVVPGKVINLVTHD